MAGGRGVGNGQHQPQHRANDPLGVARKTSDKAERLFVTLEISLLISCSSAPAESLHVGIWCLDFRSNDFAENVNTCLGGLEELGNHFASAGVW